MLHRQRKQGLKHDISVRYGYIVDIYLLLFLICGSRYLALSWRPSERVYIRTPVDFPPTCTTHHSINLEDDNWGKTLTCTSRI